MNKFSADSKRKLGHYVYTLSDPRNGRVFYVGQGKDDRVFRHEKDLLEDNAICESKKGIIKKINDSGNHVVKEIIHFGMTKKEALHSEATLINFIGLKKLANKVSGHNASPKINALEFEKIYSPKQQKITDNVLILKVGNTWHHKKTDDEVYNSSRRAWKVNLKKVKEFNNILVVANGVVRGAYCAKEWLVIKKGDIDPVNGLPIDDKMVGKKIFTKENKTPYCLEKYKNKDVSEYTKKIRSSIQYIEKKQY